MHAGGRVSNHLLGDYLRSLISVLLVQFSNKAFPGGMEGVVRLLERNHMLKVSVCAKL
jgi:hypothetical protein